jgi:hypothetical protein
LNPLQTNGCIQIAYPSNEMSLNACMPNYTD